MRIALPLAKPIVALIAFFSFVANWNNDSSLLAMLPNSTEYPLQLGLVLLPRNSPGTRRWEPSSPRYLRFFLVFLVAQRYVAAGLDGREYHRLNARQPFPGNDSWPDHGSVTELLDYCEGLPPRCAAGGGRPD